MKLSPPHQIPIILTNLLQHAQHARPTGPTDEQLTYFLAFIDCLPWIESNVIEFWLDQLVVATTGLKGSRRDSFVKRIWECVSGEMGGEGGMKAVEWWVNGGKARVIYPKL